MLTRLFFISILLLQTTVNCAAQAVPVLTVPVGGNGFVHSPGGGKEKVTASGLEDWEHSDAVLTTYIWLNKTGPLQLGVRLNPRGSESVINFSIGTVVHSITVSGSEEKNYPVGSWEITEPGYLKIEARGVRKTGAVFANLKAMQVSGAAVDSQASFVRNNDDNYFYWGRRGPSVHINYDSLPGTTGVEWFYNEVTVPIGSDIIGSYFMANGFAEGYFGMQVNAANERRVIFSVWSPFVTDDPGKIPEDKKIILVKKGAGVMAEAFGNEGSGGHSHLVYNWKAGETYRFLLQAVPVENNTTRFSAFFYNNDQHQWLLIASFKRPATHTYLRRLHSFLENFIPEAGDSTRKAFYHNQWIKPVNQNWLPLTTMHLTADATARKGFRKDYNGGTADNMFYLQNGGFFNQTADLKKTYTEPTPVEKPTPNLVDLLKLLQ